MRREASATIQAHATMRKEGNIIITLGNKVAKTSPLGSVYSKMMRSGNSELQL